MKESSGKLIEAMHTLDELLLESSFDESVFSEIMKEHWSGLIEAIRPLSNQYKSLDSIMDNFPVIFNNPRIAVNKRYEEAKKMLLRINDNHDLRQNITVREIPKGIFTLRGANPHDYSKAVVDYFWAVEKATETVLQDLVLIYNAVSNYHCQRKHSKNKNPALPVKEILIHAFGTETEFIKHLDIILTHEMDIARTRIEVVEKSHLLPTNIESKYHIPEGITMFAYKELAEIVWAYHHLQIGIEAFSRWNTYLRTPIERTS